MELPIQITFGGRGASHAILVQIRARAEELNRFYGSAQSKKPRRAIRKE